MRTTISGHPEVVVEPIVGSSVDGLGVPLQLSVGEETDGGSVIASGLNGKGEVKLPDRGWGIQLESMLR